MILSEGAYWRLNSNLRINEDHLSGIVAFNAINAKGRAWEVKEVPKGLIHDENKKGRV